VQAAPVGHAVPQYPQFRGSVAVSAQIPWQYVCPDGQSSSVESHAAHRARRAIAAIAASVRVEGVMAR
jgi:hypothetical protein